MQTRSNLLEQPSTTFRTAHSRIEAMLEQLQPTNEAEREAFQMARALAEAGDAEAAELEMSECLRVAVIAWAARLILHVRTLPQAA